VFVYDLHGLATLFIYFNKFMRSILLMIPMVFVFSGCGSTRPETMPNTVPCTITVLKSGVPVSGVDVAFFRTEGNGALSIGAKTDSNGNAIIQTAWGTYKTLGAPIGKAKVTLIKHVALPPDGVTEEQKEQFTPQEANAYEKKRNEEINKLRVISKLFENPDTTPFEINIAEKSGEKMTIDIDKL
jgi:hypothetical protein